MAPDPWNNANYANPMTAESVYRLGKLFMNRGPQKLVSLVRILQKMHDFVLSMELLPLLCLMHGIS